MCTSGLLHTIHQGANLAGWRTWLSVQAGSRLRPTMACSKGTHTMSRMHSRSLGANSALYRICAAARQQAPVRGPSSATKTSFLPRSWSSPLRYRFWGSDPLG